MTGVEGLPWGGWALDRHTAIELDHHLRRIQPRVIVETGCGASTVLLARYAEQHGARVVSLEHDARFRERTRMLLTRHRLGSHVDLRHAPLTPDGWYDTRLPISGVDFALVDGPPGSIGRHATLPALLPAMRDAWEVWMDDAHRPAERRLVKQWASTLEVFTRTIPLPRGLARITGYPQPVPRVDASDTAVTLLTGARPDLLAATVASVRAAAPGLLSTAHVTVLHNGGDEPTAALLDRWRWIDRRIVHTGPLLSVGQAVSALLDAVPDGPQFWLHLEDDWQAATVTTCWFEAARSVLHRTPGVGQVRLRHQGQTVHGRHMATGRPIVWRAGGAGWVIGQAHYTLNPSLMRLVDAHRIWPASGEPQAMRRAASAGWYVAQLTPGVFHHLGGDRSLEGHRYASGT